LGGGKLGGMSGHMPPSTLKNFLYFWKKKKRKEKKRKMPPINHE
jgi:hypothetical protein